MRRIILFRLYIGLSLMVTMLLFQNCNEMSSVSSDTVLSSNSNSESPQNIDIESEPETESLALMDELLTAEDIKVNIKASFISSNTIEAQVSSSSELNKVEIYNQDPKELLAEDFNYPFSFHIDISEVKGRLIEFIITAKNSEKLTYKLDLSEVEVQQITTPNTEGGESAIAVSGRKQQLRGQTQEGTGMLSRTGYGQNAQGGSRYIYVKSVKELLAAVKKENNYVIIDSSLSGKVLTLPSAIAFIADNVTLDGSEAPGLELYNPGGYLSMRLLADHIIINNIKLTANPSLRITAIGILGGEHMWLNKITLAGFSHDDGIYIGDTNSNNLTQKITISNLKTGKDCFGSVLINVYKPEIESGFYGRVTVHSSHLQAAQRSMKNDGARFIHFFNNYVYGVRYSHVDAKDGNELPANVIISTLSESNYFDNIGGKNSCAERTFPKGVIYSNGLSIYKTGYKACGDIRRPGDDNYKPDKPPYIYNLLETSNVPSIIKKNAGVDN